MTIHQKSNRFKALVYLSLFAVSLLALSMVIISGCSDTLEGDINANVAPQVYFVNIPPDNTSFSHNPEVYWFGSDVDGQIDYYRYMVATAEEIGSSDVEQVRLWAAGVEDTAWTYVDVNPLESDPQTAHVIPLTADMDKPVSVYVEQFVFLQAYDDDGAGSVIAVKCLNRNDHPPATRIINTIKDDTPYVNATTAGGIVTGVKLSWEGSDVVDYDEQGLVAPPFEYEWKLYGPYDSATLAFIYDEYIEPVWFPTSGADTMYVIGDSMVNYDSTLVEDTSGTYWQVDTNIIHFTAETATNTYLGYRKDTLLHTDSSEFTSNIVATSFNGYDTWVMDTRDTIYDVYRHDTEVVDTTRRYSFIFTVRCRDDARVADPTPAFANFPVIDPKFERDVLVIDFTTVNLPYTEPIDYTDTVPDMHKYTVRKGTFHRLLTSWKPDILFDTTGEKADYTTPQSYTASAPFALDKALKYKTMIWYSDFIRASSFYTYGTDEVVFTAIDAGVNTWVTARNLIIQENPPLEIMLYFGIERYFYGNWMSFLNGTNAFNSNIPTRMEDFVGAISINDSRWPSLDIDTALLHANYHWLDVAPGGSAITPPAPWIDSIAALPEVNWCERMYGTEVMYLYKSKYGPNHPLGYPYTIEGTPIGHRLQTNLYRTVYFMFPPLAMDQEAMQTVVDSVMTWLYDPNLGAESVSEKRYPDATVKLNVDQMQQSLVDRRKAR